ncbi:DNA metabolism protein [Salmonella enterica]|uniref:DNA metabolism protein n=3 Tax=Salmonella enterica I TaxID=59201 RepID=A0A5W3E0W0_SALAN|nr:DNA metabolism protein [Salmonella enterica]EAA0473032.1 DNA metabolism protein [Salmonella enterica subsp. enterica serovar Litchfield]EAA1178625.1 DNA metabolism protein [Salmonella enterica subsp. enterica serovar Mikawasima]EAA2343388.1 DNA metabolism protein [Salmonella enterica subsp. enterica serovar Montevideo]EAA5957609.1 DNA metabolism protein [Salmonella enterica subsp. enterica serovar Stanleyville]EAA7366685.1 DNA metabolism protein [Salmonella enterica subsp. enterica]EAA9531
MTPGSARHPHVLCVRSGGCALADSKLAAPMTPSGIY